jgi:creatinine amidohydrolase
MSPPPPVVPICLADDATFWPWRRWPEFSRWPDKHRTIVVVPLAGTADWGLGHPLDAEETVLLSVLRAASQAKPADLPLLVVPPLRFVMGSDPGCAFAVDAPTAHAFIADVLGSINASGFRKVVLFNASPWNEEVIAAAARDNRIALRQQIFRISLSGLGLDLHPVRSPATTRRKVQTLLTALLGQEPETPAPDAPVAPPTRDWGDERVFPLPGPAVPLAAAQAEGAQTLAAASSLLLELLGEIHAHPPLPHDGHIVPAQP